LLLNHPLPCIPCITGAGRDHDELLGAPQRGDLEEEDGMEGPEARRRRPVSSGASPAQEAAHMYARGCARGRRLVAGGQQAGAEARRW